MEDAIRLDARRSEALEMAADVVRRGGLVVFPTETFYGLATDPRDPDAVLRLVQAKGRDALKPIPLIASSRQDAERTVILSPSLAAICDAFWPGPLTVAAAPRDAWPAPLLGGGATLGIRVSCGKAARELAAACGGLITATSANLAGTPAASTVRELDAGLLSAVDLVVDGGPLPGGLASTVVVEQAAGIRIVRAGPISEASLRAVLRQCRGEER